MVYLQMNLVNSWLSRMDAASSPLRYVHKDCHSVVLAGPIQGSVEKLCSFMCTPDVEATFEVSLERADRLAACMRANFSLEARVLALATSATNVYSFTHVRLLEGGYSVLSNNSCHLVFFKVL